MKNKPLFAIFLVVLIDLLGFSLILPLLPYYAKTFGSSQLVTGLLIASYALAQLIGSPILGRFSDRFGRRPILLISIFGTFLGFILLGVANSLLILFLARIFDGLTGGNISVAQAYISDVTDEKSRAKGLGMIGAAFGLGFIIGPVTGGFLSQWGYNVPAFFAAGISFMNMLLIYFWLPESLPEEKRTTANNQKSPITLSALIAAISRPFTGSILVSRFFFGVAFALFQTIFSLYAIQRFELDAIQISYILTYVGVLSVVTQGFLVGRVTKLLREDLLILICVMLMAVSLVGWGFVTSIPALLVIMLPLSFSGGLLNTLLSSTLSKAVAPQEIGGILGLSVAVESSTRVIAPIIGGWLLQQYGTSAPGIFGALIMAGLSAFAWVKIYNHPIALGFLNRPEPQTVSIED